VRRPRTFSVLNIAGCSGLLRESAECSESSKSGIDSRSVAAHRRSVTVFVAAPSESLSRVLHGAAAAVESRAASVPLHGGGESPRPAPAVGRTPPHRGTPVGAVAATAPMSAGDTVPPNQRDRVPCGNSRERRFSRSARWSRFGTTAR